MLGAILLLVQAAEATSVPPQSGPTPPKATIVTATCAPSGDGDIIVCGKADPEQYRLRPLGNPPGGKPLLPMTAKLGNGTIDGRAVEHCVGNFCAPAAMATIKLPF